MLFSSGFDFAMENVVGMSDDGIYHNISLYTNVQ